MQTIRTLPLVGFAIILVMVVILSASQLDRQGVTLEDAINIKETLLKFAMSGKHENEICQNYTETSYWKMDLVSELMDKTPEMIQTALDEVMIRGLARQGGIR